ncbi:HAD-IA family hydrolase [Sulfobacillus harzensis]|uniref:HAD family hydrolase n=1 Tax=Sulfobacillus harzensis TaxID=2729629 RepID=UPI003083F248
MWDFDGTIVDTETPQFEAWQALFGEFGARLEPHVWGKMVGTVTDWDLFDVLERLTGGPVQRIKLERKVRRLIEKKMTEAPIRDGVGEIITEAAGRGLRQAVASSSPRWWIREFLRRHRLESYFAAIASADDVRRVKPDPEVYLTALARLKVGPLEAIAIEDSPHGSRAALQAGIPCLVVPNPSTMELPFPVGVHRLDTLKGVTLDGLQAVFQDVR